MRRAIIVLRRRAVVLWSVLCIRPPRPQRVAAALQAKGAPEAAALRVAERYVEAFSKLAKESNTLLLPANAGDPAAMVAQALGVFGTVSKAVRGGEEKAGEGQGAQ